MQINNSEHLERATRELQQMLAEQELRLQACLRTNQNISRVVSSVGGPVGEDVVVEPIVLKKIAIAKGMLLSPKQFQHLNKNDYDVVLDAVDRKLLARKDPDQHTKLEECNCKNIGRDRLRLLRCWLENPRLLVCEATIPRIFGGTASMTPNALAKAILEIRRCLWAAPYIVTERDWGEHISSTGSVYVLSDKYKYLVIKYRI